MSARKVKTEDLKNEAKKLGRLISISYIAGELYYHFYQGKIIAIRVRPEEKTVDSLVELFPNAGVMERELHDFFGIVFKGNPRLKEKLFISDDTMGPVREG